MYLLNEGTIAVGVMTAAFAFAFLLVVALGAYVVYCDAQNRVAETEFEGIGHEDPPAIPVGSTAGTSDAPVAAAAAPEPPAEHHARSTRRRAKPPRES
jgi:hypothetical protein